MLDRLHAINGYSVADGMAGSMPDISACSTIELIVSPPPEEHRSTRWRSAVFELTLERDPSEGFGLG